MENKVIEMVNYAYKTKFEKQFRNQSKCFSFSGIYIFLISCVIPLFFGTYSFGSDFVESNAVYGEAKELTSYDEPLPQEAIEFLNAPLSPEEQAIANAKESNNLDQSNDEQIKVNIRQVIYDEQSGQYYKSHDGTVECFDTVNRTVGTPIQPLSRHRYGNWERVKEFEMPKDQRMLLRTVTAPLPGSSPWTVPIVTYYYFNIVDTHQDIYMDLVATCSTPESQKAPKDGLGALAFVNLPGLSSNNIIHIDWTGVEPQQPGCFVNILNPTLATSVGIEPRFTVSDKFAQNPYSIYWEYWIGDELYNYLGEINQMKIELTPNYDPADYEFVGWFRYREDDSAIGQKHLVQCYTGDTFADWANLKAGYSSLSDWLLKPLDTQLRYYLMANFRPINPSENYNVRINVADKDKDKGFIAGSNGDEPANMQDYTLKLWSDSSKDQNVHFGIKTIGDCSDFLEFDTYDSAYLQDLQYPYRVEDPFVPYMFRPQANDGYVFDGWTAVDDQGNRIDINNIDTADKASCVLNRNITFYVNFKQANEIYGVISDKDGGQPIENALVSYTDNENNSCTAITDENGEYSLCVNNPYGTITASSNGYQSSSNVVNNEGNYNLTLEKIDYCVYLSGDVYKLRSKDHKENPGDYIEHYVLSDNFDFYPYYAVAVNDYKISFTTSDGYYSYYQNEPMDESAEDGTGHYNLAIPFGSSGVFSIEKDGFECFRCYLNSDDTSSVGVGDIVNVANLDKEVYQQDGKFLNEDLAGSLFDFNPMTVLQPYKNSGEFSCVFATANSYAGSVSVDGVDTSSEAITFPADTFYHLNLANGDITIDNSWLDNTENSGKLYTILPVDNKENKFVFHKWIQYTKDGDKSDLYSSGKVLPESVIFAEFIEGSYMNFFSEDPGHATYNFSYENTTTSVDVGGAVSWQASTYDLKQYNLASFSVVKDEIVCRYSEIQDGNNSLPYYETTTIKPVANQGFVFDHWMINGDNVADVYQGIIDTGKNISVQAVYSLVPPEPVSDNTNVAGGSAQTGDVSPLGSILAVVIVAALCCVLSVRKQYLRL